MCPSGFKVSLWRCDQRWSTLIGRKSRGDSRMLGPLDRRPICLWRCDEFWRHLSITDTAGFTEGGDATTGAAVLRAADGSGGPLRPSPWPNLGPEWLVGTSWPRGFLHSFYSQVRWFIMYSWPGSCTYYQPTWLVSRLSPSTCQCD